MKVKKLICLLMLLFVSSAALKAYNVTFYVNGQVYSTTNVAKSGQEITLTPPNRREIDCPFDIYFYGWSTNNDPVNPNVVKGDPTGASMADPKVKVTSDMNFYAMWHLGYNLVYSLDYYTVTVSKPENGSINTAQFYDGEYFSGETWVESSEGNTKLFKVLGGKPIAFEAQADDDYEFDSWSVGFNRGVQQSSNKVRIEVNGNGTISASFKAAQKVDYTALNNKQSEARNYINDELQADKYETIKWTLYDAIEEAESLKMFNKTQAEIDAGVNVLAAALTKAMNDKETIDNAEKNDSSKIDYTALNNKQAEVRDYIYNELQEDKYESIKWTLYDAVEEAESLKMFDRTQAEIDAGVQALADALTKAMADKKAIDDAPPTVTINYDNLIALYNEGVSYYYAIAEKSKYSEPANKLLNELLEVMNMIDNKTATSQQQVDNAYDHLSKTFSEVKETVAAIDKAEDEGKPGSKKAFEKVYEEAKAYYNEIYYDYGSIASSFQSEYSSAASRVTWGGTVTDEEYDTATATIEKAIQKAKEAVAAAKVGYNEKELTDAISDAVAYYKGIVSDHADVAATLALAIERANTAKANLTSQSQHTASRSSLRTILYITGSGCTRR